MLKAMKRLVEKAKSMPNVYVTTTSVVHLLREMAKEQGEDHDKRTMGNLYLFGIRIEDYNTIKECLDRMMNPAEGELLQLVIEGDIPERYMDHPWVLQNKPKS